MKWYQHMVTPDELKMSCIQRKPSR